MTKPLIRVHNAQTNEIVDREMTDAEFKSWNDANKADEQAKITAESKRSAALAKLEAIGLDADDLKAIGLA